MRLTRGSSALLCVVLAMPAAAQQTSGAITVAASACAALAQLNDAPGVAYQPGVDAGGNRVAPADLPGEDSAALDRTVASAPVKITVDLRKRFGIPADATLFRGRSEIGYVAIEDGKAYLDGVPLSLGEQGLLAEACRDHPR